MRKRKFSRALFFVLKCFVRPIIIRKYNVQFKNSDLFSSIKPPFLLIANHSTELDPFLINLNIPYPVQYVMSDSNLRSWFKRFLYLKLAAVIPKTKAVSDTSAVREMVELARQGSVIGVFPEGSMCWDGKSGDLTIATAKLIRLLKIPVVCAVVKGGYLSRPRWADSVRRGLLTIQYQQVLDKEQASSLKNEEILDLILHSIAHNEYHYRDEIKKSFCDPKGTDAHYLERILFTCPNCSSFSTLLSSGKSVVCTNCGYRQEYSTGKLGSSDLDIILDRQKSVLSQKLTYQDPKIPVFIDDDVWMRRGVSRYRLLKKKRGILEMYEDRFVFIEREGQLSNQVVFPFSGVLGVQVLRANHLEFQFEGLPITFNFVQKNGCAYKYLAGVQFLCPEKAQMI